MSKKKNILRDLLITELSLVDQGANPGAHVVLFKRKDKNNDTIISSSHFDGNLQKEELKMDPEKLIEQLVEKVNEAFEPKFDELTKELKSTKDELDSLKKSDEPNKDQDIEPSEPEETVSEEEVIKMDEIPEGVKKYLESIEKKYKSQVEEATALAKKNREEFEAEKTKRERIELEKRVDREIPNLAGSMDEKVNLLKRIGDDEYALKQLHLQNELLGDKMVEKGHSQNAPTDPEAKLDVLVKQLAEKEGIDEALAYEKVLNTNEGKKLYTELTK